MTEQVYSAIQTLSAAYQKKLAGMTEEQFQLTPPIGGWSYSEVYAHIFDASILSLIPLGQCIQGIGERKPTSFTVRLLLLWGRFPPYARYKVPEKLASRVKKINRQEAQFLMETFHKRLEADYSHIHEADKNIRNLHPRLGYLNATSWLRFIQIHLNHHLQQLKRIEKSF
ncbi:DinB family protein [Pedobacter sp. AW31-3R]|uniref:DinB family protein n=1 Tax=Pedobacter sp. AW31-3R TaxID=3445781 RepID=UPI003F9EE3E6